MPAVAKVAWREPSLDEVERLKSLVQTFARNFGLLVTKQTPCGYPVSPSYAHALMVLLRRHHSGLDTSQSELGMRLGIDKSNVARLCSRLESSGHATQQRAPDDGRGRHLTLTVKGRRMAERLEDASNERFFRLTQAVLPEKRSALLESLEILATAVQCLEEGVDQ